MCSCMLQVRDGDRPHSNTIITAGSDNNRSLALVLASPTPVTWHLTSSGYTSPPDILLSDGSRVLDIETGEEFPSSPAILSTLVITENLALAKFSSIHSFTSLSGANRIFIRLPSGRNRNILTKLVHHTCITSILQAPLSPTRTVMSTVKRKASQLRRSRC